MLQNHEYAIEEAGEDDEQFDVDYQDDGFENMMEATLAESSKISSPAKKKKKAGFAKKKTTKTKTAAAKKENPFVFKSSFTQKNLDQIHLEAGSVTDTLSSL